MKCIRLYAICRILEAKGQRIEDTINCFQDLLTFNSPLNSPLTLIKPENVHFLFVILLLQNKKDSCLTNDETRNFGVLYLFFGRSEDTINCFRDLLTFNSPLNSLLTLIKPENVHFLFVILLLQNKKDSCLTNNETRDFGVLYFPKKTAKFCKDFCPSL